MPGKALVVQTTDSPNFEALRISIKVSFIGNSSGFLGTEEIDVTFLPTDTVSQIRTKVRQTIVARGAEFGLSLSTADVSSIMQI